MMFADAIGTQRPCNAPARVVGIPWLEPRFYAFFKLAHDLVGDALIDVRFHGLSFHGLRVRMNPTSHAAMSGGWAVTGQKTRSGADRSAATTRSAFFARRAWP